eukprot:TRINITY_DN3074_c0_g1_i2.p1 TRINITY_DN3074_c0_g1~~TRINITY_DN3074_c0_g1_i2.p1  ORF type:complete len:292 (+),score=87.37 TRINITY_DN3074_c0_g1_i2:385-1260(+)
MTQVHGLPPPARDTSSFGEDRRLSSMENKLDRIISLLEGHSAQRGELGEVLYMMRTMMENQKEILSELHILRGTRGVGVVDLGERRTEMGQRRVEAPSLAEETALEARDYEYKKYIERRTELAADRVNRSSEFTVQRSRDQSREDEASLGQWRPSRSIQPVEERSLEYTASRKGTDELRTESVGKAIGDELPRQHSASLKNSQTFEDRKRLIDEEIERRIKEEQEKRRKLISAMEPIKQQRADSPEGEFKHSPYSTEKSRSREVINRLNLEKKARDEKINKLNEMGKSLKK